MRERERVREQKRLDVILPLKPLNAGGERGGIVISSGFELVADGYHSWNSAKDTVKCLFSLLVLSEKSWVRIPLQGKVKLTDGHENVALSSLLLPSSQ